MLGNKRNAWGSFPPPRNFDNGNCRTRRAWRYSPLLVSGHGKRNSTADIWRTKHTWSGSVIGGPDFLWFSANGEPSLIEINNSAVSREIRARRPIHRNTIDTGTPPLQSVCRSFPSTFLWRERRLRTRPRPFLICRLKIPFPDSTPHRPSFTSPCLKEPSTNSYFSLREIYFIGDAQNSRGTSSRIIAAYRQRTILGPKPHFFIRVFLQIQKAIQGSSI